MRRTRSKTPRQNATAVAKHCSHAVTKHCNVRSVLALLDKYSVVVVIEEARAGWQAKSQKMAIDAGLLNLWVYDEQCY